MRHDVGETQLRRHPDRVFESTYGLQRELRPRVEREVAGEALRTGPALSLIHI